MNARALLYFLVALVLTSCTVTISPGSYSPVSHSDALRLRPASTPDVMIIGFAGRCGVDVFYCDAPRDNEAYLGRRTPDGRDGVLQTLGQTFVNMGHSVEVRSYRSHLDARAGYGGGYLQAQEDLSRTLQQMVTGYSNPTRLVLVGHSHGTNFATLLAMDNPSVTFDYMIYLDGICYRWEYDHLDKGYFARGFGSVGNFPKPLSRTTNACNSYPVPYEDYEDIKDVVPDNTIYALEVRSAGFWSNTLFIKDHDVNTRTDGRWGPGVGTYVLDTLEGHSEITRPWSAGMRWIVRQIQELGLPAAGFEGYKLPYAGY